MSDTIITYRLEGESLIVESQYGIETYDPQFLVAALLLYVARGTGTIEPEESSQILELIQEHFNLAGADSLQLVTRAMAELSEKPELFQMITELGQTLSDDEKEEIALMALKVIAADGRREVAEMERFSRAVAAIEIPDEIVHKAFDRYFSEALPGD